MNDRLSNSKQCVQKVSCLISWKTLGKQQSKEKGVKNKRLRLEPQSPSGRPDSERGECKRAVNIVRFPKSAINII